MKRIVLIFFVTLLVFASTTFVSGAKPENTPKEEIIYGILDDSGNLASITVVNGFTLEKDATIADYGNYASFENLSTSAPISKSGNSITLAGKAGRTTYRGELENRQLPWNVKITYYLDGKAIDPADLAGKSGKLKIAIQTSANPKEKGTFYDDFSLQITVPLKMDLCENIQTSGATIADNGSTKQFSYVVLPGKDGAISLTADVTDFEMEGITLAGVRMSFDLPLDVDKISSSIDKLVSAAQKLDKGAVKLIQGAKALQTGMAQYTAGFNTLNSKVGQLESGADALTSGISDLGDGLSALSDQGAGLRAGASDIQQSAFDSANASLTGMGIPTLTPENYTAVLGALPANPMLDALKKQLDDITAFTDGVEAYTLGTTQLATGAAALETGAGNLAGGISTLADGLDQLYGSAKELNSGMKAFLEGVSTYRTGTKAFSAGTSNMEQQLNGQLDSLMNLLSAEGKVFHSYVSDENTNVNFVQFVIKTDGITIQKEEPAKEPKPVEKSLWEKFLDLFR